MPKPSVPVKRFAEFAAMSQKSRLKFTLSLVDRPKYSFYGPLYPNLRRLVEEPRSLSRILKKVRKYKSSIQAARHELLLIRFQEFCQINSPSLAEVTPSSAILDEFELVARPEIGLRIAGVSYSVNLWPKPERPTGTEAEALNGALAMLRTRDGAAAAIGAYMDLEGGEIFPVRPPSPASSARLAEHVGDLNGLLRATSI